jgi:hypothetical protein
MDTHTLLALSDALIQVSQCDLYHTTPEQQSFYGLLFEAFNTVFETGICHPIRRDSILLATRVMCEHASPFDPQEDTREWLRTLVTG